MKKLKSDYVHNYRFSKDLYVDCEATKRLFDILCNSVKYKYPGYIQEIIQNPFGLLLMSDIQVSYFFQNNISNNGQSQVLDQNGPLDQEDAQKEV